MAGSIKKVSRRSLYGTGFQGYLYARYADLVKVFGEPHFGPADSYDGKIQAEWGFRSSSGEVFSVYDYKSILAPAENREWHVGGRRRIVLAVVLDYLIARSCPVEVSQIAL